MVSLKIQILRGVRLCHRASGIGSLGPSDEDTTILRNSGNCLPDDAASHTEKSGIFFDEICVCVCRNFSF